jgi:hypothetical protein
MTAISNTPQALDSTRTYQVNAKRPDGSAYAFAGHEALACAITAVGGGPALAMPDIAFLVPSAGTLTVTVRASQVAGLSPGTYGLDVTATPVVGVYAGEPLSVWSGTIAFEAAASAAVATPGWTMLKLELALTRKRRAWLSACEMDFAASGHNLDLVGPITQAIRFAGGTVSDPVRPADADLATVPADQWDAVLDVADYLLVEALVGNWDSVTLSWDTRKADYNDLAARLRDEAARLLAKVQRMYGYGLAAPVVGTLDLGFSQAYDPDRPDWRWSW